MNHFSGEDMFGSGASVYVERSKSFCYGKHTHEFLELVYIKDGTGKHIINDVSYDVKKGDLLFINYGKTHSFESENGMDYYNILLTPEFISEQLTNSENAIDLLTLSCFESFSNFNDEPKIRFSSSEIIFVEQLLNEMEREFAKKDAGYTEVLKSCITVLLIHIFRKMDRGMLADDKKIPAEILDYIDNNYNEKITIKDLAKRCFYNPSYFSRIFSEIYGMTITEYISERRFEKACQLLSESDMTVEEVARSAGYRDTAAIFRHFKKKLGITPGDYRKN